jgi:N-acetylglutamate synthase-like GNAT family acetyltransferase
VTSTVRTATADDYPAIARLLEEAGLPTAGVADALAGFVVAEEGGALVGVAGLEVHGRDGVLRSVAVAPRVGGSGLGGLLTERILDDARRAGLRRLYLLTTTAADYFPRYGFRVVERDSASPEVRASVEFRDVCPASAVAMALDLAEAPRSC